MAPHGADIVVCTRWPSGEGDNWTSGCGRRSRDERASAVRCGAERMRQRVRAAGVCVGAALVKSGTPCVAVVGVRVLLVVTVVV